eukprot:bmy_20122T0
MGARHECNVALDGFWWTVVYQRDENRCWGTMQEVKHYVGTQLEVEGILGTRFLSMDGLLGVQILEIFYIKVSRGVLATTQGARSFKQRQICYPEDFKVSQSLVYMGIYDSSHAS